MPEQKVRAYTASPALRPCSEASEREREAVKRPALGLRKSLKV